MDARRALALLAVGLVAGCSRLDPAPRCEEDAACGEGLRCSSDGLCVPVRPNAPPVAATDGYVTVEDLPLSVGPAAGVLANDRDPDGDRLEAVLVSPPASGTLDLAADGSFRYAPAAHAGGIVSFTYRASDGRATSGPATVYLEVVPAGDAPVALADAYVAAEGTPLVVSAALGVLANDVDPDGGTLRATLVAQAGHGRVTLDAAGSFTYVPDPGFSGRDFFGYVASDGTLASPRTLVIVDVVGGLSPPAAADDAYAVDEDAVLAVTAGQGVLANDTDADGDALSAVLVAGPAHGTLALAPDGSFSYRPAADWSGADAFTYQASDGALRSATTTVALAVAPVNDAPVAVADAYATDAGVTLAVAAAQGVLANDRDAEGPLAAVLEVGPAHGTVTLDPSGAFSYAPAAGFDGTDGFTYRASDGALSSAVVTVVLTVRPGAPPAAPVAAGDAYGVDEDGLLVVAAGQGVLANDSDANGDPLTAALVSGPAHGILVLAADGSFTYDPGADWSGTDQFTYRASDGTLTSAPATATITVAPVNDPPVAVSDFHEATAGVALVVPAPGVLANDTDADGDALHAEVAVPPAHGTLALAADGSFSYTADGAYSGSDGFRYVAVDAAGARSASEWVELRVAGVNRPPVADSRGLETVTGVAAGGRLTGSDPDGDALRFSLWTLPAHGSVALVAATGDFTYTPEAGYTGLDAFTFTVSDGRATSSRFARVAVEVLPTAGPWVASLLPAAGGTGRPLELHGRAFGSAPGTVTVGGRPATVLRWTDRLVIVTVAAGYEPGPHDVVLTTAAAGAAAAVPYDVRPWIDAIDPEDAPPGATITLTGDGFGSAQGTVTVDGQPAVVEGWTGTAVQVQIPAPLAGGPRRVRLSTAAAVASNVWTLTVRGSDVWTVPPVPAGRTGHRAVWTGTEVVVFGGMVPGTRGARYDPKTGRWRHLAAAGAPALRTSPAVVWTGEEVVVWGGFGASAPLGDGARWDPVTDTWRAISAANAPSARYGHVAAWTGQEMLVWGGQTNASTFLSTGGRYDPRTDTWAALPSGPGVPPAATEAAGVWTGREWILHGGYGAGGAQSFGSGLDPVANVWRPLPDSALAGARRMHGMVWTGREVVIVGGSEATAAGARYDPATERWSATAAPAQGKLRAHVAWTGAEVFVVGGCTGTYTSCTLDGRWEAWDPATDAWRTLVSFDPRYANFEGDAVFTGSDVLVTFGREERTWGENVSLRLAADGASWERIRPRGTRPGRSAAAMAWTGAEAVVWGGSVDGLTATTSTDDGARWSGALAAFEELPAAGGPGPRLRHTATWTGDAVVFWGGRGTTGRLATGARWIPASSSWERLPTSGAPAARSDHSAVWTGAALVVWGGDLDGSNATATGGRWRPGDAAWTATSTAGAPAARQSHAAVWTGARMFVWGGKPGASGFGMFGDGALYDPTSDGWTPTSAAGAPAARYDHTALWNGSEVLVWGGRTSSTAWTATGGRYDPATDSWRGISTVGAPAASGKHHAVWTGSRMLVWYELGAGALYDPATDTWGPPMSTVDAPWYAAGRTSVWTGEELLLWGGASAGREPFARYRP